jgi:uncharacterized integral membrane protein
MYLIGLLVVFALFGVFAVQNGGTQDFTLLGYTWNLPVWAPAAIGTGLVSLLLLLHMSHAGMGSRFREFGHGRAIDQHRGLIEDLRTQNAELREQLAEARGAMSATRREPVAVDRTSATSRRSWVDGVRDRFRGRETA